MKITDLIKKYEQMRYMNKKVYFDADEFGVIANYYKNRKKTTEAEDVVNLGLKMHPLNTELMIIKTKILIASKRYELAYDYLLTIAEDEANVDLLLVKFECLLNLNRISEADAFLKYILEGELDDEKLYTFITEVGYLYSDADQFETAIKLLERALKIEETDMDVLIELTYAYEMSDNLDKAIELTNAMIDLDPYSFDSWVSLGRLYSYNFEYDKSIEAFDFALAIKESDVDVLKLKALTHNLDDNYEEELKLMNECIDASPDDESLYDDLVEKYEQMDEYWGTDHHLDVLKVLEKKAERFGPKDILLKMARIYISWDKYDEALDVFKNIPKEDKKRVEYYKLKGDFALREDDSDAAESAYLYAYSISPVDKEVLDSLAEIYWDRDDNEKAASYLEQLIAVDPEYGIVKFRLACVRFDIGEKEPFINIINQISDEETLRILLDLFAMQVKREKTDYSELSREELLIEMREVMERKLQLNKK